MYQRYRRQGLEDELEELAQIMEETLLQQALADGFFDETIEIDRDAKTKVRKTIDKLERARSQSETSGETMQELYDSIEESIDTLRDRVEGEETKVQNRIQQLRIERQETVSGMRRLNERVERADSAQLEALEHLLDDWNWKTHVYSEGVNTYEERREEAIQYGEDMSFVFEQLKNDLFGVYDGTKLRPLVDKLLDDERLVFGSLTETERQQLAESDLGEYIELKLS
jgi:chromosome segregation ATPase